MIFEVVMMRTYIIDGNKFSNIEGFFDEIDLIMTIKCVCRQAHSPHKVTPCDALGLPFPIKLTEPRPVDRGGLSACVLALCFGNLDALCSA